MECKMKWIFNANSDKIQIKNCLSIQTVKKSFKVFSSVLVTMRLTLCNWKPTILFRGWNTMKNLRSGIWMRIIRLVTPQWNTSKNAKRRKHCFYLYSRRFIWKHFACRTIYSAMGSVKASQKLVAILITSIWTVFSSTIVAWLETNFRRFLRVLHLLKTSSRSSTSTTSWMHSQFRSSNLFSKRIYLISFKSSS